MNCVWSTGHCPGGAGGGVEVEEEEGEERDEGEDEEEDDEGDGDGGPVAGDDCPAPIEERTSRKERRG